MKTIITIACLATSILSHSNADAAIKLRFIGDQNITTGEKFKDTEIGGLSGITFDKKSNRFIVISDDKGLTNDPRFYEFDYKLDEKSFKLVPANIVYLKNKDGNPYLKGILDCEDVTIINDELIISTEGNINKVPPLPPELLVFGKDGRFKRNLEVPLKFLPDPKAENKRGIRNNQGFEALSKADDNTTFWTAAEEALYQDDRTTTPTHSSTIRIIEYHDYKAIKEFGYKMEPVPSVSVAGLTVGEIGLTSILSLDNANFLTTERSFLPLAQKTIVKVYQIKITEKTTDISKFDSIKNQKITTVEKEFVADLEDFSKAMSDSFRVIDNIEGMSLGPKLANGNRTIILISDNNFRKKQRTQILAFEILP